MPEERITSSEPNATTLPASEHATAFCPKCGQAMATMASECRSCGYDFPMAGANRSVRRSAFAHSRLSDLALLGGTIGAGIGCLIIAVGSIAALVQGNLANGLVIGPLAFLLLAGVLGVFLRIQEL
jgi:predicted RNA-binding Zn-ribbon protein involved in translation (DUF1610 family)